MSLLKKVVGGRRGDLKAMMAISEKNVCLETFFKELNQAREVIGSLGGKIPLEVLRNDS